MNMCWLCGACKQALEELIPVCGRLSCSHTNTTTPTESIRCLWVQEYMIRVMNTGICVCSFQHQAAAASSQLHAYTCNTHVHTHTVRCSRCMPVFLAYKHILTLTHLISLLSSPIDPSSKKGDNLAQPTFLFLPFNSSKNSSHTVP